MSIDVPELDDPFDALYREGQNLTGASRKAIVEEREDAVRPLIEVVEARDLWDEEAPGGGFAPIHAAEILGDLRAFEAIEPMYEALADCEPDAILDTTLTRSLQQLGEAVVEPGIEMLDRRGEEFRDDLACVFAGLDVDRRVVFQVLVKNLVDNPMLGARNLAMYGDPEALDALFPMLNRLLMAAADDPTKFDDAKAVGDAIEELGGELSDNQAEQLEVMEEQKQGAREILERVKRGERDHDHPDTHVNKHDIGRNEPCWCGSGQKYKYCHWEEDRR